MRSTNEARPIAVLIRQLGKGQPLELRETYAPGEAFAHPLHQREVLTTGEQESARVRTGLVPTLLTKLVNHRLQVPEEPGSVLNLVDEDRGRVFAQERVGIPFCLLRRARQVERDVVMIREGMPEKCRLAGLPCAGDDDRRKPAYKPAETTLKHTFEVHVTIFTCKGIIVHSEGVPGDRRRDGGVPVIDVEATR